MRFILLFSLLFVCFSASAQTDSNGNISIQPGDIIRFTPHFDATKPIEVKYTKSWQPAGQSYTLYGYKQIVILKQNRNGSFEFAKYRDAFMAAVEDYRSLTQRN